VCREKWSVLRGVRSVESGQIPSPFHCQRTLASGATDKRNFKGPYRDSNPANGPAGDRFRLRTYGRTTISFSDSQFSVFYRSGQLTEMGRVHKIESLSIRTANSIQKLTPKSFHNPTGWIRNDSSRDSPFCLKPISIPSPRQYMPPCHSLGLRPRTLPDRRHRLNHPSSSPHIQSSLASEPRC
jgi:hypothetical protein